MKLNLSIYKIFMLNIDEQIPTCYNDESSKQAAPDTPGVF